MVSLDQPVKSTEVSNYILQSQNATRDDLAIENVATLPELFRWQAQRRQDATLFSFRSQLGEALSTVSYTEAYETSSRIASSLHELHRDSSIDSPVVDIWLEKSIDLYLAILATTISGAAWLPFDADAPSARVNACLGDSKACVLLCDAAYYDAAKTATENLSGCHVVTLEELSNRSANGVAKELPGPRGNNTAYMIYTSGSTGTPKGIEIPYSAALGFCLSERPVLETGPDDIVWQGFSAVFDMFIEEV